MEGHPLTKFESNPFFPDYNDRVRKNLQPVVESKGFTFARDLQSITRRQLYRIRSGQSSVTIQKLQMIADEIGVDLLDFFKR
jgi:transcriptional regulator with XRE-family HTH domain